MGATVFYSSSNELATLTNTFSVSGTATDPTAVTLVVLPPSGTSATYTYPASITKTSTGIYTKDVTCNEAGVWHYRWEGTGTASDAVDGTWTVFDATGGKLYATVEELKSRLGIGDTVDDFELRLAVETASRAVDDFCGRHFWRGTATKTFTPDSPYWVKIDDLVSATTLATDATGDGTFETTWSASDYQLYPLNATTGSESRPYTRFVAVGTLTFPTPWTYSYARGDRVQVVGVFGWPAVPAAVKTAALILAADAFKIKDAPFGIAGGMGEWGPVRVRDNPRAVALLRPYRRDVGSLLVG